MAKNHGKSGKIQKRLGQVKGASKAFKILKNGVWPVLACAFVFFACWIGAEVPENAVDEKKS